MEFLVRLVQVNESFRQAELNALAEISGLNLEIIEYNEFSPFCIVRLPSIEAARTLISRSILTKAIYELWGQGPDYDSLHTYLRECSASKWPLYKTCSFKYTIDSYLVSRSMAEQRDIVESFSYMAMDGPIMMRNPDAEFTVFEDYEALRAQKPRKIFFGRLLGYGGRDQIDRYTLKKRKYISTTSMDSELALVMANLALSRPGKLFYDPFVGTGSLPIACSHFGALSFGSDIDGRSVRGKKGLGVRSSYRQYGLGGKYVGGFVADLTHTPLRAVEGGWLDGIVCDPPYGVREGLKVLGSKDGGNKEVVWLDGVQAHLRDCYIPPKQAYSFEAMLADILDFAVVALVEDGRLSLWMPTANDEEKELGVPSHGTLELVSVCVQPFNKWSRRLLTYRKRRPNEIERHPSGRDLAQTTGATASDLNNFRKRYFEGFKTSF